MITGTAGEGDRAVADLPRLVSVRKYSGGTVAVLSHGLGAQARLAGDTPSMIICYDGGPHGEPTIISTADGSPVAGGAER